MATYREGPNIDIVGRFVRRTVLNEALTLPLAAAATYLTLPTSRLHLNAIARAFPSLRLDSYLTPKASRIALALSTTGLLLSLNDLLTHWFANNFTRTRPSQWDWSREIVLITGGSSGIGASLAQHLLARNPHTTVVILDFAPLGWTPPQGANVHYYQADLSGSGVIRSVCAQVREEVGNPTVLVNNAGIARGFGVMEGGYADVEVTVKTNLVAPMLLVKEFLPRMVERDHGHVVSLCSMSSVVAPAGVVDYAATKSGIMSFHEGLQIELAYRYNAPRVRLTNVIPNFIKTPLFRGTTGLPSFFAPLLHVDTVGEAITNALYSGYGGTIYLPGLMRYVAMLRGAPEWMLRMLRNGTAKNNWDFRGRQGISKTGGLVVVEEERSTRRKTGPRGTVCTR